MELETLRRVRRVLSAVLAASAIMLVMARVRSAPGDGTLGTLASAVFLVSLVAFIVAWRKEHTAAETSFAERERQQLASLRLQVELAQLAAKKKESAPGAAPSSGSAPSSKDAPR